MITDQEIIGSSLGNKKTPYLESSTVRGNTDFWYAHDLKFCFAELNGITVSTSCYITMSCGNCKVHCTSALEEKYTKFSFISF